jgi:hypothetical protein
VNLGYMAVVKELLPSLDGDCILEKPMKKVVQQ